MDALTRRILEHVRKNPGCTSKDICASLPSRYSEETAWFRIVHLSMTYEIENRGGAGHHEDVRWHILEEPPAAFYLEFAADTLKTLKTLPPRKQAKYLARRIQEFTEDNRAGSS